MVIIFTALNLLCLSVLLASIFSEAGAIKISILTVTAFSFLYVIVSGLFFWIDAFSFNHVLGILLIFTAPLASFLFPKKISVLTVTLLSFLYVIVSGLFFWTNGFTFIRLLETTLIFAASLAAFLFKNTSYGNRIICHINKKTNHGKQIESHNPYLTIPTIEIILIVLAFLLSFQNFELFSIGRDEGGYQAAAIDLYMGNYEVEHDFEEYRILEREEDKAAYSAMLTTGITGPISLSSYYSIIGFQMSEPKSDVSGMYHGILTFPAILALGGKLFGLENMMQIQTVFLICSALLLYYALCNMEISTTKRLGALAVFLLSPLVLWISKSSLTEMILTLCVSFYLFLLTETDTPVKRYLLAFPLVTFAFVHVSFLIVFPVFVLIHALLFFQSRQREYIWVNLITSAGLAAGYSMMSRIAPRYFFVQASHLYYKNIITINNFLYWIFFGCILVSVCSLLLLRIKDLDAIFQRIIYLCKFSPILVLILLCVIVSYAVVIGCFRTPEEGGWRPDLRVYYGDGFLSAFSNTAFFAFAMATGFLVMLCVLWYMIRCHRGIWGTPIEIAVYFLFLYGVLFRSAFITKEVAHYYYYSRYLVFYIPIICIAFALLFRQIKGRSLWAILALSIAFMLVFDVPMLRGKDTTGLEWETLQDLEMAIQDDSAIILGPELTRLLGAPIRAISGEALFPVLPDVKNEIELLRTHYSNIYYLSWVPLSWEEQSFGGAELEVIYRDRFTLYDTGSHVHGHFPLVFPSVVREMSLYRIS